jgi:hypothetical protein
MQALIWICALVALGGWTLLAWAAAWVLGLDPSLVGQWPGRLDEMPGAAWLDLWVPGWDGLVLAVLELMRGLFALMGGIGPWLVWGAWAVGAVLVLGTATLSSVVVAGARRALAPAAGPAQPGQA